VIVRRALPLVLLLPGCLGPSFTKDVPPDIERVFWEAPTGRVSALRAGDPAGVRVIMVHGTPGTATDWNGYLTDPPNGVEVLAIDRPGFGCSAPWAPVPELSRQVAALESQLVKRDGGWPILMGHSLGGPIVVRAAIDHPDRVGAIVVLAGNLDPELERLHWYNSLGTVLEPLLRRPLRNSNRELKYQRRELEELAPLLEQVTCPVIIVHGTEDSLVPYANAEYLQSSLTGSASVDLVSLEGVDHFFIWTDEESVRRAIESLAPAR
jgi:pimeloyl-ACP methyl ester carboxylesterase